MKVSITNHTGARNRGCEALVLCKIFGLTRTLDNPSFTLHSNDPVYDAWRFSGLTDLCWSYLTNTPNHPKYLRLNRIAYSTLNLLEYALPRINGVNVQSIKTIKKADLVVASGGDIFTSDYNNMRKHLAYPILSTKNRIYLCSQSIGPFNRQDKEYFLRVTDGIGAISAREKDTYDYLRTIDVQSDIHLTADVAFTLPAPNKDEVCLILKKHYNLTNTENLVALSISQGIIKYSKLDQEYYYTTFARLCDALIDIGKKIILIPHVVEKDPANNDIIACHEVIKRTTHDSGILVLDGESNASLLKGIIGCCECLIGTRTHATIAAMSQGVPTVSIAYSRKAYGITKDVYGEHLGERLVVDARKIDLTSILDAYYLALNSTIDTERLASIKGRSEMNFHIARLLLN